MKRQPPGPATNGAVTPRVEATATAASIALPPRLSVSMPASLALNSVLATAPPVPVATGPLTYGAAWADAAGRPSAVTRTQAVAAMSGRASIEHPNKVIVPFTPHSGWPIRVNADNLGRPRRDYKS